MINQRSRQGQGPGALARETPNGQAGGARRQTARGRSGRRRRRARSGMLLVAALVGLAAALGLVGFVAFSSGTGTASIAAQRFCDTLVRRDYAAAYGQLARELRQEGTAQQFAASQQALDRLNGDATACRFSEPAVAGDHATFTLTLTRASAGRMSGALGMVLEAGAWRVDAYDANVI